MKVFEISDVCLIDNEDESGAVNRRRLCFAYTNLTSGIEVLYLILKHKLDISCILKIYLKIIKGFAWIG